MMPKASCMTLGLEQNRPHRKLPCTKSPFLAHSIAQCPSSRSTLDKCPLPNAQCRFSIGPIGPRTKDRILPVDPHENHPAKKKRNAPVEDSHCRSAHIVEGSVSRRKEGIGV